MVAEPADPEGLAGFEDRAVDGVGIFYPAMDLIGEHAAMFRHSTRRARAAASQKIARPSFRGLLD